jgi:hypothetical protein
MSMRQKSVCIVISGHITCCPRMMKMAVALSEAGHVVSIVNPIYVASVREADQRFLADPRWHGAPVEFVRQHQPLTFYRTGLRMKLARHRLRGGDLTAHSLDSLGRGCTRAYDDLLSRALAQPADLYLGGTAGGLVVAARAAEIRGVPLALDLEDFHPAEQISSPEADLSHALIAEIQRRILPHARFLTAGSKPIQAEYERAFNVSPHVIHNVFSLPAVPPRLAPASGPALRLFWFSQVIGPQRGLEASIAACGLAGVDMELHLLGGDDRGFVAGLENQARRAAPRLKIKHHNRVAPDRIVAMAERYDVGLSVEPGFSRNNELALSNKSFAYLVAGLAVAFTDTPGQRELADDIGAGALIFETRDTAAQAAGFRHWAQDASALLAARKAAWAAAVRRWHWEHPQERDKALALVRGVWEERP